MGTAELYDPYLGFPHATGASPTSAPFGGSVTITGGDLGSTFAAFVDGHRATFHVVSDSQVAVSIPSGALTGPLALVTPVGVAWSSVKVLPTISSFTPTSGRPGATITIAGSALTGTTHVIFNGKAARFRMKGYTKLSAVVPTGARTGLIAVTTAGGTATSRSKFTVR